MDCQGPISRAIAYIDGFNLYFGICDARLKRYLWLDLNRLVHAILLPEQRLVATKYFTAPISGPEDKRKRQLAYLEALSVIDKGVFSIISGTYMREPARCRQCGYIYAAPKEKETDASIAVEILKDGIRDTFDTAILVTGDTDQCPTVRAVHELWPDKKIVAAFPPSRYSSKLATIVDAWFVIGEAKLRQSQFLPCFKHNGRIHAKPAEWA